MNLSELDFYNVLNVPRNATWEDITLAYRRLAIKLCPFRDAKHQRDFVPSSQKDRPTHLSPMSLNCQWKYINMAYHVLGNDLYRSIYDRFGESGLLQGVNLPNGCFPPYQYHGNHMKVYHDVFGSYSPYANVIDTELNKSPPLYKTERIVSGAKIKEPPVVKVIYLDLEEVYKGCIKLMHVWRQEFVDVEQLQTKKRKKTLTLNIPPGVTAGTCYSFKEEGDRCPTTVPSDIIFMVDDVPHQRFKRVDQHNLGYRHKISLCQALTGFKFTIETLDGRKLKVSVSDVVTPEFKKILPGEGLPKCISADVTKAFNAGGFDYGDIIIEFQVIFPKYLTPSMKCLTRNFFADLQAIDEGTHTEISS